MNNLWAAPVLVMYRLITECVFGYEIQAAASIGRRFTIHHGYGVVINKHVVAGMISPCAMASPSAILAATICPVRSSVTALVGANVTLLGGVAIGDNVTIGAGSVVVDSIPDNTLVVGEKARVKVIK